MSKPEKLKTFLCIIDSSGNYMVYTEINDISENKDKNYIALYFLDTTHYELKERILIPKKPVTYEVAMNFKKNNMA